ncbi:MAG: lamin tail domain-containing protein [Luteolibacter sp.]
MASNTRAYPDITDFEDYPDWIELKNTGVSTASLNGYFLSDDPADPFKWPVPSTASIAAGGFQLFMADGHDAAPGQTFPRGYWPWRNFTTEKYHTNFNLSSLGETLTLTQATGITTVDLVNASTPAPVSPATVATWKYKDNGSDQSTQWRARIFDDAGWASGPSELGYGDAPATTVSYGADAANKYITTYFRHTFNVANPAVYHGLTLKLLVDDGCVIYLNGAEVVRRNMPDGDVDYKTLATLAVGGTDESTFFTYHIPASGLVTGNNVLAVEVHQSAANSSDVSFDLGLTGSSHTGATAVDSITYTQQVDDVSYGRDNTTPATWKQFAEATPGAANTTAAVNDVRVTGNAVSFSLPAGLYPSAQNVSLSSPAGPIRYTLDGSNPRSTSTLYTGPISIATTTALRARCFETGKAPGAIATATYIIGETQGSVPYVSVVADPETLFGNTIGIYTNLHEPTSTDYGLHDVYKGKDAPGQVEFFPSGGAAGFRANCGIRIGGENNWVHPQKALNISVRGKYGDDEIKYDIFPGSQIPIHNAFTLRDGGDNWNKDMLRDCMFPKLAVGHLAVDTADYRPSVVFINGAYYGLHDIRQRWDETWFGQKYHIAADKIDHLLYGHVDSASVSLGVEKGSSADWLELMAFLNTADLTNPTNWAYAESKIDIDSFMDFVISESYGNNTSWLHNREFWKEKKAGAKWKWFLTDMDRTFSTSTLTGTLSDMLTNEDVLKRLKLNNGFKQRLAQRYAAHMAGTFTTSRVQSVITQMDTEVTAEVPRHVTRWSPNGTTVAIRATNIQQIKDYATQRSANFNAEVTTQLGVGTAVNFTLGVNNAAQGQVFVQGVPVDPSTFKMFPNIAFTLQAVPAPGYVFTGWTGATGGESISLTITGAQTVTANFAASGETVIGGTLASNTTLTTGTVYTLSGDLIVPAGITLTIPAGVVIHMPPLRNIRVQGVMNINGTAGQPVSITGRNGGRWGGISFEDGSGPSNLAHLIVRGATKGYEPVLYDHAITGHNATVVADFIDIDDCDLTFYMFGGSCTLRDSVLHSDYTGDGIHVKKGAALIQRCTLLGNNAPDTDAIDFDGVINGVIEDCKIYRFQGSNSDGIDIGEACSNVLIQGTQIYYNSDKGVSVGQGSTVTLRKLLVVGCTLGVGIKDLGSAATIDQCTFASCGTGVAIYEKNFGSGGGSALITNSIISKPSTPPVTVDSFSSATVSYSLSDTAALAGTNNILADPLFVDPVILNFQLQPTSPAINSGDPAHALDPDATIVDRGARYTYSALDYPYTIGETIVVNELLANSGSASDWIELHNRTAAAVNIGGWFLSDSSADLSKYRIPAGTIIPAGGYLVYHEDTNFGTTSVDTNKVTPFALSDAGETVYLSSAVNDELTDYQTKEDFGPSNEGETLGSYYKPSSDSYNFIAMKSTTPGSANSGPRVGPIVISEIMYNPAGNGDAEYIELLNVSNAPVTLYDPAKAKAWRISDGIDYEFPAVSPLTIAAGERVILTKSLTRFNTSFGTILPAGTKVFEWITGSLSNAGENLQLDQPGPVDSANILQYVRMDRVNYDDEFPWFTAPDGNGPSLSKMSEKDYGNDYINWISAGASPGAATPGSRYATWASSNSAGATTADDDHDGLSNLMEYALGTDPHSSSPVSVPAVTVHPGWTSSSYQVSGLTSDLDYYLEASSNLQQWTRVDAAPVSVSGNLQTRTYQESTSGMIKRFYRLGVSQKP